MPLASLTLVRIVTAAAAGLFDQVIDIGPADRAHVAGDPHIKPERQKGAAQVPGEPLFGVKGLTVDDFRLKDIIIEGFIRGADVKCYDSTSFPTRPGFRSRQSMIFPNRQNCEKSISKSCQAV